MRIDAIKNYKPYVVKAMTVTWDLHADSLKFLPHNLPSDSFSHAGGKTCRPHLRKQSHM